MRRDLRRYIVTFGVQYGREAHPDLPGVTGEHYLEVLAPNEIIARRLVAGLTQHWAFIYSGSEGERIIRKWCPSGRYALLVMSVDEPLEVTNYDDE